MPLRRYIFNTLTVVSMLLLPATERTIKSKAKIGLIRLAIGLSPARGLEDR